MIVQSYYLKWRYTTMPLSVKELDRNVIFISTSVVVLETGLGLKTTL